MSVVKQSSIYKAILTWTQKDERRKIDFTELFLLIELPSLSIQFLDEVVSKESFVRGNNDCLDAFTAGIIAKLKGVHPNVRKILCVIGHGEHSVFEVYYSTGNISKAYPSGPNKPQNHSLLKSDNFVYGVGGYSIEGSFVVTNKAYRLNLSEANMLWSEMASMSEKRQ